MAVFNFTFQPNMPVEHMLAFKIAGEIWTQYLEDDITVDIQVGTTHNLPENVLGGAAPSYVEVDVASLKAALAQDATSGVDDTAIANLGLDGEFSALLNGKSYKGNTITLTQAQAEALGLTTEQSDSNDGYILLNALGRRNGLSWSTDFMRNRNPDPQKLDLLSVALHEIGHILGFISGVDADAQGEIKRQLAKTSLLDLFRYSDASLASNSRELTRGAAAYFSLDGGTTEITSFATGIVSTGSTIDGYQASHWGNGSAADSRLPGWSQRLADELSDDPVGQFIQAVFKISQEATGSDWVDSPHRLLVDPSASRMYQIMGNTTEQLGIMDPNLAVGDRSNIAILDLIAFDAIGYDITHGSLELDYANLLTAAETSLAEQFHLTVDQLNDGTTLTHQHKSQGHMADILKAMNRGEIYERRRTRRKNKNSSFWQEKKIKKKRPKKQQLNAKEVIYEDHNRVEIFSNQGEAKATVAVETNSRWVTQVRATPRAPLTLRIQSLQGTDADDLMIPVFDQYQTLQTGNGNNIVQLGFQGGQVFSGVGNDLILAKGGNSEVIDQGGDNFIWTQGSGDAVHHITTGKGSDHIRFIGYQATVNTGAGNDVVVGQNQGHSWHDIYRGAGYEVNVGNGDNTVFLEGSDRHQIIVTAGSGNDLIRAHGSHVNITTGAGSDTIILGDTPTIDVSGYGNFTVIQDFDHQDKLLLFGNPEDYSIRGNFLLYQNQWLALLRNGIDFHLDGPQVSYFHDLNTFNPEAFLATTSREMPSSTSEPLTDLENARARLADLKLTAPEALLQEALEDRRQATEPITYGISGGADRDRFTIDSTSGDLHLKPETSLNSDANQDNIFEVTVTATQGDGKIAQEIDQQMLRIRLEDVNHDSLLGSDESDTIDGSDRDDVIQGRAGDDIIAAGAGNDTVTGGAGNDALIGGFGNDIINGSNSVRRGQGEIDHYLEGGAGADRFILGDRNGSYYTAAGDQDYAFIADYTPGIDQVMVFGSLSSYTTETIEGATWLLYQNDPIAVFDGITHLNLNHMKII